MYRYSPDRKAERPQSQLASFSDILQADGYSGIASLYADARVRASACWAHARRKFYSAYAVDRSSTAAEALRRIGLLYAIVREIRGQRTICGPRDALGADPGGAAGYILRTTYRFIQSAPREWAHPRA